ncbi:hypothetical protein DL1_08635 [Thioclava dalianensis]|uniref:Type II toxin-antitoxin system RelE/ParE family toxin n=1 Tax=Thioclava dalianensis TaxID=1185766 RepID=A0A074TIK7_9RHOB|nr:hypothetical protein [Thioclava dalianensis]KEP68828.1 hypothetical protein DL1_08635 [Thioclava dalianensis]SFN49426.1 hypothetical protein SAMN05216224_10661 [Thioclava dalianensis]
MNEIHPAQRARERGITSVDGLTLVRAIERAIRAKDDKLVERVMPAAGGGFIYRFRVPVEGIFYAISEEHGRVRTIITQEMLRYYKRRRRFSKKKRDRNRGSNP